VELLSALEKHVRAQTTTVDETQVIGLVNVGARYCSINIWPGWKRGNATSSAAAHRIAAPSAGLPRGSSRQWATLEALPSTGG